MREIRRWTAILQVAAVAACSHGGTSQPAPAGAGGPGATQAPPTRAPGAAPAGVAQGGPPGAPRRRLPPNPMAQDTARRAMVDSVLGSIAGRELEPAGKVFKNVKVLKEMPAGDFVRNMDTQYGRGLGWTCNNCHLIGQFDSDSKKDKRTARYMQRMTIRINNELITRIPDMHKEFDKVTCVMCHRGVNETKGTMAVPPAPAPAARPG